MLLVASLRVRLRSFTGWHGLELDIEDSSGVDVDRDVKILTNTTRRTRSMASIFTGSVRPADREVVARGYEAYSCLRHQHGEEAAEPCAGELAADFSASLPYPQG